MSFECFHISKFSPNFESDVHLRGGDYASLIFEKKKWIPEASRFGFFISGLLCYARNTE